MGANLIIGDDSDFDTIGNWIANVGATLTGGYDSGDVGHETTLRAEAGAAQWSGTGLSDEILLTTGKRYRVTVDYKHIETTDLADPTTTIYFISGETTQTFTIPLSTGSWSTATNDFTATVPHDQMRLYINWSLGHADNEVLFDNVSLREIHAADLTPNANNGTVYGATYTTDRNAQSNKAMDFDGTSDYISIADTDDLDFGTTDDFSVSAWFKRDESGVQHSIIAKGDTNASYWLRIQADDTINFLLDYSADGGDADNAVSSKTYTDTNWHHVVGVADRDSFVKLYVDDVLVGSDVSMIGGNISNAFSFQIGLGGTDYLNGSLQDIRIHDRALTQTEITELYESYNPKIKVGAKRKGLVGEWSLDGENAELYTSANASSIDNEADATTGWTKNTMNVMESSSTQQYSGDYSMHIVANGGSQYCYTSASVVVGKKYRVSVYYYGVNLGGDVYGRLMLGTAKYDTTYSSTYFSANGAWTELTYDITATAANLFFTFVEADPLNASDFYVDYLTIREISVSDSTPYENNGTRYGTSTTSLYTTDRHSQSNKAMSFDGTDDYINIDTIVADVASDTQGTWALWMKPDDGYVGGQILAFGDTNAFEELYISLASSGTIRGTSVDNASTQWVVITDNEVFASGTSVWNHVAMVQDGTSPVLYINGVEVAQTITDATDTTDWMETLTGLDNARIGCRNRNNNGNVNHFDGSISDVRIYNRALSAAEIADIYDDYKPIVKVGALRKGLVGHWTLDDKQSKSDTVVADATIYENNGTMTSMTFSGNETTDRHGQTRALNFDGAADYINIASGSELDITDALTVSAWAKWDVDNDKTTIVSKWGNSDSNRFSWILFANWFADGRVDFLVSGNGTSYTTANSPNGSVVSGQWYYITGVYDGSSVELYIDGILQETTPGAPSALKITSTPVAIGIDYDTGTGDNPYRHFDGSISDLRIYNRALSVAEVEMLYEKY